MQLLLLLVTVAMSYDYLLSLLVHTTTVATTKGLAIPPKPGYGTF